MKIEGATNTFNFNDLSIRTIIEFYWHFTGIQLRKRYLHVSMFLIFFPRDILFQNIQLQNISREIFPTNVLLLQNDTDYNIFLNVFRYESSQLRVFHVTGK